MASPELLQWCREGGVCWNGIEAGYVAEGWRGVLATNELEPGTCVLRVPRRLLMSVESARRDTDLAAALQQCTGNTGLTSEQILAAHLLHEASKGPASFWHPYLLSLPRTYTTAMCFSKQEAAELQVEPAVGAVQAASCAAAAQHAGALPLLRALPLHPPAKWRSRAAWLWAASTLSSRTMYLPGDPAGALTPFGDLHNYRPPPPPYTPSLEGLLEGARALAAAAAAAAGGAGGPVAGSGAGAVGRLVPAGVHGARAAGAAAGALSGLVAASSHHPGGTAAAQAATATAGAAGGAAGAAGAAVVADAAAAGAAVVADAAAAELPAGAEGESAAEQGVSGDGHLDEAAGEYRIFTRTRVAAGEQVFLCYGRHTNLELLQHYGFILPDNPHDTATLPPHLLPLTVRQQLGPGMGSSSSGSNGCEDGASTAGTSSAVGELPEAFLHASGAPSWDLLRALRLGSATSAERKAGACRALAGEPISAASERAAFAALLRACEGALAALPTSIEEDERQLEQLRLQAALTSAAGERQEGQWQQGQQQQRQEQGPQRQQQEEAQQQKQPDGSSQGSDRSAGSSRGQWAAEKLCLAVEWRLCHKRILQRGAQLCSAVLGALPRPADQAGKAAGAAEITARLAALQRKPRW